MGMMSMLMGASGTAKVQFVASSSGEADGASSVSADALNTVAGNLLVAFVRWNYESDSTINVSSVTDTAGNTYTSLGARVTINDGLYYPSMRAYYVLNASGNASNVVAATFNKATIYGSDIVVVQYSGVATSAALVTSGTLADSGATRNTHTFPTLGTSPDGGVVVSGIFTPGGFANVFTAATGTTKRKNAGTTTAGDRIYVSGGSYATEFTTSTAYKSAGYTAMFKQA